MEEKIRHTESKVRKLVRVLETERKNEAKIIVEHILELMKDTKSTYSRGPPKFKAE